ncbi:TetR-like C-terminal domain-containing protein [Roseixanthobacter glucoisosaccharinicivorans]|uniref:TetR-like C-terminal domain-containing protein n=1 Tax=Roseixanthobacter glucoisosaccharinicivorans TaxID=3119923 RepID=UPI00372D7235
MRNVCAAYVNFARSRPIVYEAMFVLPTNIKFASDEAPSALRAAFEALVAALGPNRREPVFPAEVLWGALHGLVVLTQSGRIPASGTEARFESLLKGSAAGNHTSAITPSKGRQPRLQPKRGVVQWYDQIIARTPPYCSGPETLIAFR